ncbi:uncharacterized protein TNCT_96981 [Trichonephila clavata]|uniref:Uncharacterized protein n=1 Tax=Trichonephila clavata TaxID=2740835 RepID=A0A8X6L6K1_TRICU|nr:uncharacterized protein TNCT_96981 [Trichonephila clavata]
MAATAFVITSFSACMVVERCLYTCTFKCSHRKKKSQMINRVTSFGARRHLFANREEVQETTLSECPAHVAKCEPWLRFVGTRFLLLHGLQETGLILVRGKSRSCESRDMK